MLDYKLNIKINTNKPKFNNHFKGLYFQKPRSESWKNHQIPLLISTLELFPKKISLHKFFQQNSANLVDFLISYIANPNFESKNKHTPLIEAILENDEQIIKMLINIRGIDLNSKDNEGYTALMWAIREGKQGIAKILIETNGIDLNSKDKNGSTALMWAASIEGNKEIVQILIDKGADLNIQNNEGYTAFLYATNNEFSEVVDILIEAKAALNIQDNEGQTALIWAANMANHSIVKALLQAGANPNIQNNKGFTAIMQAASLGLNQIVEMLFLAGAEVCTRPFKPGYKSILSYLKSHRQTNFKSLFTSISEKNKKLLKEFKEETLLKAISHSTSLDGLMPLQHASKNIPPFIIDLEGFSQEFWLNKMRKATELMHKNHPTILSEKENNLLIAVLLFGSNLNTHTIAEILNRIQKGSPVAIRTGYSAHEVSIIIWGSYFIICNRGMASRASVEIFHYDQEKLNEKILQDIIDCQDKGEEDYEELFFTTLPNILDFKQEELEKLIQEKCPLPPQLVGNCSWFSPETAVWAFFVWKKIRESEQPNVEEIIQTETERFNSWLVFNQLYHLERYMNIYQLRKEPEVEKDPSRARNVYKIDTDLIRRAFESSFSIKDEEIDESIAEQRRLLYDHFTTNF